MNDIQLAIVLTAAGAMVLAPLITGFVSLLKATFARQIDGHERMAAFVLSLLVVVAAIADGISKGTMTLDIGTVFGGVLAFYALGRLAIATYDDVTKRANSLTGPSTK